MKTLVLFWYYMMFLLGSHWEELKENITEYQKRTNVLHKFLGLGR